MDSLGFVRFTHYSVHEFLKSDYLHCHETLGIYSLAHRNERLGQEFIATSCLTSLMLEEIAAFGGLDGASDEEDKWTISGAVRNISRNRGDKTSKFLNRFRKLRSKIPILTYSLKHWVSYIQGLEILDTAVKSALLRLFNPKSPYLMTVMGMYKMDVQEKSLWPISQDDRWSIFCNNRFLGLHVAVFFGFEDVIRTLCRESNRYLLQTDSDGSTALHISQSLRTTRLLLDLDTGNATLEMKDFRGMTPLHRACSSNQDGSVPLLREMLRRKADPNGINGKGASPLHIAASTGGRYLLPKLKELKSYGADPNITCGPKSYNALQCLLSSNIAQWGGDAQLDEIMPAVDFLLQNGASPSDLAMSDAWPWARSERLLELLSSHGFDRSRCTLKESQKIHPYTPIRNPTRFDAIFLYSIQDLLRMGFTTTSLNCSNQQGNTVLHCLSKEYHQGTIDPRDLSKEINSLLLRGAEPNARDSISNATPLHYAAQWSSSISRTLILHEYTDLDAQDSVGRTALHIFCRKESRLSLQERITLIKLMFDFQKNKRNFDPNKQDTFGKTPLLYAALWSSQLVEILLHTKSHPIVDATITDYRGHNVLHAAVFKSQYNQHETGESSEYNPFSHHKHKLNELKDSKAFAIFNLIFPEHTGSLQIEAKDEIFGRNILHYASQWSPLIVEIIMEFPIDETLADTLMSTALHHAAYDSYQAQPLASWSTISRYRSRFSIQKATITRFLLRSGSRINPNAKNIFGQCALHYASQWSPQVVREILAAKTSPAADPNILDLDRDTAAHIAARYRTPMNRPLVTDRVEIIRLLHQKGADLSSRNNSGASVLHNAAEWSNVLMVELLDNYKLDLSAVDNTGATAAHYSAQEPPIEYYYAWLYSERVQVIRTLGMRGIDLNSRDYLGRSALHYASRWSFDCVQEFVSFPGLDVTAVDHQGNTALHFACARPQNGAPCSESVRAAIVRLLLAKGFECGFTNNDGIGAVYAAILNGGLKALETIRLLWENGADPFAVDNSGKSALDRLGESNATEAIALSDILKDLSPQIKSVPRNPADAVAISVQSKLDQTPPC